MIQISPAILTSDEEQFNQLLLEYIDLDLEQIDIDINVGHDHFQGKVTVQTNDVIDSIALYSKQFFGIHLMVDEPLKEIEIFQDRLDKLDNILFYIHQESNYQPLFDLDISWAITVKAESKMNPIEFYTQFPEVQLMTVTAGKQGSKFLPEVLSRADWLLANGYNGKISIDGGVNPSTMSLVAQHGIQRVSVGSYLQNSENKQQNLDALLQSVI